jgi:hypothetical protein
MRLRRRGLIFIVVAPPGPTSADTGNSEACADHRRCQLASNASLLWAQVVWAFSVEGATPSLSLGLDPLRQTGTFPLLPIQSKRGLLVCRPWRA